ncbi:MAG: hypothetical protein ACPG05_01540 [Bdellovibrionales bacterium]
MSIQQSDIISPLGIPNYTWVIGSVHSDIDRLTQIHDSLLERFSPGDRLVYTGNYTGHGFCPKQTLEEILTFRRLLLSIPGVLASDITYLRGQQEEILSKLFELPFSQSPEQVFMWMLKNGLSETLEGLGIDQQEGVIASKEGVMSLCRWTGRVRGKLRTVAGYDIFMSQLKRAAYTHETTEAPMLFVNAGINLKKPLNAQGDNFWWASDRFKDIHQTYDPFKRIIRGFDPQHEGVHVNGVTATIDGGCGFGGTLACAGFDNTSSVVDLFEV